MAPVTLWLTESETKAALEDSILRDVDPAKRSSYWTDRGKGDMYVIVARPQTLEFFPLSV